MEFWGVEVKAGEPFKVKPESDSVVHLSQAALGETKKDKGNDSVMLSVKVGEQKIVLGTLSSEKCPQLSFDVVFEKEFELSHNWKNGSVYLCGYQSAMPVEDEENPFGSSDEDEEDVPTLNADNGAIEPKEEKKGPVSLKSQGKRAEPSKAAEPTKATPASKDSDDDDDEDFSDEEDEDDSDDAEDMSEDSDGDEESEEDDSEDEETPKKVEVGKKRTKEAPEKTPAETKKAKLVTPLKTDGKKAAHTATPHPAKAAASNKQQTPKSGAQFSCKSCERNFNSETALQSHTKAKHDK